MAIAALVVGMFGGFAGIYFALLLVIASGLFGAAAALAGSRTAVEPLYWGLAALGCYTLGTIGGALATYRPRVACWLMLVAAIGGIIATLLIGPSVVNALSPTTGQLGAAATPQPRVSFVPPASETDPRAFLYLLIPFGGPALLVIGALLAAFAPERD